MSIDKTPNQMSNSNSNIRKYPNPNDGSDEYNNTNKQFRMHELGLTLPSKPDAKKRITSQDWYTSKSLNHISDVPKDCFGDSNENEGDPDTSAVPNSLRSISHQSCDSFFPIDNGNTQPFPSTEASVPFDFSIGETVQSDVNDIFQSEVSDPKVLASVPFDFSMIETVQSEVSQTVQSEVSDSKVFCTPTNLDVLLGRGGKTNNHAGNVRYREEVIKVKPMYHTCRSKAAKKGVSELLVFYVQDYGGRFLEKDKETGNWILAQFKAARKKASQALRETKWKPSNLEEQEKEKKPPKEREKEKEPP